MEWQPPRINSLLGIQMFFGIFGLTFVGLLYSRRRPDLTDIALFFGFSIFALTALRNTCWFAMIAAPLLARLWAHSDLAEFPVQFPRLFPFSSSEPPLKKRCGFNLCLAGIAVILLILASPWIRPRWTGAGLLDSQTPVKAIDFIQQHQLTGRIFHPQIFGDYLIWRLYPRQRSFIDGRVHLFGDSFVRNYQQIFYDSQWESKLQSFGISYLLLPKDSEETESTLLLEKARKTGKWRTVFEDKSSILLGSLDRSKS